ncbi:hypothetical protein LCGC14_0972450 [marine sediment metagenome]|uniref:DUF1064 domain-containing protein n=1 Tax=marine sediment metagenome TaxID=412755 RepID=A0A0F9RHQ5_9ZZZZ
MVYVQRGRYSFSAAKRTDYNGAVYDSKLEAGYAQELDLRIRAKDLKSWERQVAFRFALVREGDKWVLTDGEIAGKQNMRLWTYYLDFVEHNNDGTRTFTEVKGRETTMWRMKWRMLEALYGDDPEVNLLVVK